jgi:hypothetical protein
MRAVGAVDRAAVSAQVAAVVSLVEAPANHFKAKTVAKEAMAIMFGNKTGLSIKKFLESPFAVYNTQSSFQRAPRRRRPRRQWQPPKP